MVLIDMDMPKNCAECEVNEAAKCGTDYKYLLKHEQYYDSIRPDCPLKEYFPLKPITVETNIYAADVRPVVRAAWQSWEQDKPPCKWYSCDYCGFHSLSKSNFCPNCGAKMTEDRHEQKE